MGDRDGLQLVECLGHGDVENLFAPVAAGQDELHAQSGFAGPRLAFDEVEAAEDEAAAENVVQSREPGRGPVAPIQSPHSPSTGSDAATATRHQSGHRAGCSYQDNTRLQDFVHRGGRTASDRNGHRMSISLSRNSIGPRRWNAPARMLTRLPAGERGITSETRRNGCHAQPNRRSAIDRRTTRHPGYAVSGRVRKRIEEVFGWAKSAAGFRKTRHRGLARVGWMFTLTATAYNLVRLPKLVGAA